MKNLKWGWWLFCVFFVACQSRHSQHKQTPSAVSPAAVAVSEAELLVISGHPNLNESTANRVILSDLETHFGKNISLRRLDVLYPDYKINVAAEEQSLLHAKVVVLQFPLYWYTTPALLKKWLDEVLLSFFDGEKAGKFQGKQVIVSLTTGAPSTRYQAPHPSIEAYLLPLQETFTVLGGEWLAPVFSCGYTPENSQSEKQAHKHAQTLIHRIEQVFP